MIKKIKELQPQSQKFRQSNRMAHHLRQSRDAIGITQREAAHRTGVSLSTWQYYELGRRWPRSEEALDAIAWAVETTASQLLRH